MGFRCSCQLKNEWVDGGKADVYGIWSHGDTKRIIEITKVTVLQGRAKEDENEKETNQFEERKMRESVREEYTKLAKIRPLVEINNISAYFSHLTLSQLTLPFTKYLLLLFYLFDFNPLLLSQPNIFCVFKCHICQVANTTMFAYKLFENALVYVCVCVHRQPKHQIE